MVLWNDLRTSSPLCWTPLPLCYSSVFSSTSASDFTIFYISSKEYHIKDHNFTWARGKFNSIWFTRKGNIFESKKIVDEVLEFLLGKQVQIKDMFHLGRFTNLQSSSSRPRPLLIKLCTAAWDRKLVLLRKSKLRDFHIKHLFIREDVAPDHKLRQRQSVPLSERVTQPSASVVASNSSTSSSFNHASKQAPPPSDTRQPQCLRSSRSASPGTMSRSVSPSSTSSASSLTVVLGSGGNQNGSS